MIIFMARDERGWVRECRSDVMVVERGAVKGV